MVKKFIQKQLMSRWFLIAPVVLVAFTSGLFWVDGPRHPIEPRTVEADDEECAFEDADRDHETERHAERLENRPIVVQFGEDIPSAVRARIEDHLTRSSTQAVDVVAADTPADQLDEDKLAIGFGDTAISRTLLEPSELAELGEEGYLLRSGEVGSISAIAADGRQTRREGAADVGALYGAYALLEELGFGFLHPLEPTPPLALPGDPPPIERASSPRWDVRGLQLHTMHPLELTDLLQGWGPGGPDDEAGWEAMLDEWDTFLEWMLANGQNRVHWVWLATESWDDFARSDTRIERIERLVDRAHEFGIEVGLDVPLRLQQQNSGRLIRSEGSLDEEVRQIEEGVDYVMQAGFDYLVTESGTTEVTAPNDERMLAWMDALTATAEDDHGVPVSIKVHASTGQQAENFADPETGEPINFNFLPHYADERLGVLPHSVQHYALDDPAPTYGNDSFEHIRDFMQQQAGKRPTVWHPETAYWVSFDNDVPLFLPLYASRRVHDLRLLAGDEEAGRMGRGEHAGSMMDGQLTFSSGWEWGYWLQEVVTARAAWNPHADLATSEESLRALLEPVERVFGKAGGPVAEWLVDYTRAQQELLIEGRVDGYEPTDITRRNGQAYLQGFETWDDVSDTLADELGQTHGRMQPERVGLAELRDDSFDRDEYTEEVAPLLEEMDDRFTRLHERIEALEDDVPANALGLYEDFVDGAHITALRARQIRGLYAFADADARGLPTDDASAYLEMAREALDEALGVVAHRESHYRVPAERIAGWRDNPTVYRFTYLWTVRTLYYWQRDEAKAVAGSNNPCRYNVIDPVNTVLGEGTISRGAGWLGGELGKVPALQGAAECMAAPTEAPAMPVTLQPGEDSQPDAAD